jgi:hypothetical protein
VIADGTWLAVKRTDPRAFGLYRRHYSAEKNFRYRRVGNTNVAGSGSTLVLLSQCCRALFVWIKNTVERLDHQSGVNCAVFRNEGAGLSSDLIREADDLAWRKWPGERHFTYVDADKVQSRNPGYCFLAAGWQRCGFSAAGLLLLERLP